MVEDGRTDRTGGGGEEEKTKIKKKSVLNRTRESEVNPLQVTVSLPQEWSLHAPRLV